MTAQCRHLKPCNAMAKFRKEHGVAAGDVNWKHCETCPLRSGQSGQPSASPQRTPGFLRKAINKG